jgi:putative ABC transport system ATP-binding protein
MSRPQEALVSLRAVSKSYLGADIETRALDAVSLEIRPGEFVAIAGPSGCGKSTLLNVIGMLEPPQGGEYVFDGRRVDGLREAERAGLRNSDLGFIFQSFNLIDSLTAAENVELPLVYGGKLSAADRRATAAKALERVGLAHRARHNPSQLSGGQQQRVAIARAIVAKPRLLLADEPTGNLDSSSAGSVMELLSSLNAEGTAICMVTHDPRYAIAATRTVSMLDGRIG